jgi:hypothetical protein
MAAQQSSSPGGGADDLLIAIGLVVVLSILFVFVVYSVAKTGWNTLFLDFAKLEVWPAALFLQDAQRLQAALDTLDPRTMQWEDARTALSLAGHYGRFWLLPPMGLLAWHLWKKNGWTMNLSRRFTMKTLAEHNVSIVPCLAPVVRRKRSILDEPTSTGPWRVAESPMLFAIRHGIVRGADGKPVPEAWCFLDNGLPRIPAKVPDGGFVFDKKRAEEVYAARVGPQMPPIAPDGTIGVPPAKSPSRPNPAVDASIPLYLVGLIGAYCAFALGKRSAGLRIMDAMSLSFNEEAMEATRPAGGDVAGDFPIDIADAEVWIRKALKEYDPLDSSGMAAAARRLQASFKNRHDAFLYVWFGNLVNEARKVSGTSPPFEALWLRPTNRPLWYYYEALGGMTPMAEGAGPWAHYLAERVLHAQMSGASSSPDGVRAPRSTAISTPYVWPAVQALRRAIEDEGWLAQEEPAKTAGAAKQAPVPF